MNVDEKPLLLIFPFGLLSHYLRCLVLAKQLHRHFKVVFLYHPKYAGFIEDAGFTTFHCKSIDEVEVITKARNFDFSWITEETMERAFRAQAAVIEQYQPIAVLGDAMPTLKMAAEFAGVPYISLVNSYMTKYYAATRIISKTHPMYNYLSLLPASVSEFLTEQGEAFAFRKIHQPLRKIRNRYHLAACNNYLDEHEGDITLLCDLPSLFPLKPLPEHCICVGPLIYDNAITGAEHRLAIDPNKKTIFISMGSTGEWASMDFLNDSRYNRYNIIAAGDSAGVLYASHVTHVSFINARDILPYTDVVICHGGNGTIYQALAYGVPLLCKSSHFEQEWNIAAVANCGLAESLDDMDPSLWAERIAHCINKGKQMRQELVLNEIRTLEQGMECNTDYIFNKIKESEFSLMPTLESS